jgi:reverse gyrase
MVTSNLVPTCNGRSYSARLQHSTRWRECEACLNRQAVSYAFEQLELDVGEETDLADLEHLLTRINHLLQAMERRLDTVENRWQ